MGMVKDFCFTTDLDFDFPVVFLLDRTDFPDQGNHLLPSDVVAGGMGKDLFDGIQMMAVEVLRLLGIHRLAHTSGLPRNPEDRKPSKLRLFVLAYPFQPRTVFVLQPTEEFPYAHRLDLYPHLWFHRPRLG